MPSKPTTPKKAPTSEVKKTPVTEASTEAKKTPAVAETKKAPVVEKKSPASEPEKKQAAPKKAPATPKTAPKKKNTVVINYRRHSGDYEGWGVHLWNLGEEVLEASMLTSWDAPKPFDASDGFGKYLAVKLNAEQGSFGFLLHREDEKDGGDLFVNLAEHGREIWIIQGNGTIFLSESAALATLG